MLDEDKEKDWFNGALAGYCLWQSDFRYVHDQAYIKRCKLYGGTYLSRQAAATHPSD